MRKILLTTLIGVLCLTGCGNTTTVEETANEVKTDMVKEIEVEEDAEEIEIECMYTEEHVEDIKMDMITRFEANWTYMGITEEGKDELIELAKSIEYDPSFECGYDYDSLERDYINILVKYDIIPNTCAGLNWDEIDAAGIDCW